VRTGRHAVPVLAALAAAAGLVHGAAAPSHVAESAAHGLFFVVVATAQLGWAAALLVRRPSRPLLAAGVAGNAAVAGVWAVTRAGGAEPVGLADAMCTAWEVAVVAVGGALVARPAAGDRATPPPSPWARAGSGVSAAVLGLATVAVAPGLHSAPGEGHGHGRTAETAAATATGGPVVDAVHGHGEGGGDTAGESAPNLAQRAAADALVAGTRAALVRFGELDDAVAAGYRPITPENERIVHYGNPAYILDGAVLDHQRVESLVYARTARGPVLLGAMYMAPLGGKGPRVGGPLTQWHIHDDLCIDAARLAQVTRRPDGSCPPGSAVWATPEMLHVWSVDYPTGPFGELTPLHALQVLAALGP
jgi:hypothetical protein